MGLDLEKLEYLIVASGVFTKPLKFVHSVVSVAVIETSCAYVHV